MPMAHACARCAARTRAGTSCRSPAMRNGRCRLHGGLSTGPTSPEGLARLVQARTVHGGYGAEMRRFRDARAYRGSNISEYWADLGAVGDLCSGYGLRTKAKIQHSNATSKARRTVFITTDLFQPLQVLQLLQLLREAGDAWFGKPQILLPGAVSREHEQHIGQLCRWPEPCHQGHQAIPVNPSAGIALDADDLSRVVAQQGYTSVWLALGQPGYADHWRRFVI